MYYNNNNKKIKLNFKKRPLYVHRINSKATDKISQLVLCRKSLINEIGVNNKEIEFPSTLESLSYSQYAFF